MKAVTTTAVAILLEKELIARILYFAKSPSGKIKRTECSKYNHLLIRWSSLEFPLWIQIGFLPRPVRVWIRWSYDLFECEYVGATTCSSVNTLGLRPVQVWVRLELVLWVHRLKRNRSSPHLLHSLAEPYCSVLEVAFMVRHYGSDRSCSLPRLSLVNEAVLCSK